MSNDARAATQQTLPDWDSLATITLVGVIEEEFNIRIDFEQMVELDAFAAIAEYLEHAAAASH